MDAAEELWGRGGEKERYSGDSREESCHSPILDVSYFAAGLAQGPLFSRHLHTSPHRPILVFCDLVRSDSTMRFLLEDPSPSPPLPPLRHHALQEQYPLTAFRGRATLSTAPSSVQRGCLPHSPSFCYQGEDAAMEGAEVRTSDSQCSSTPGTSLSLPRAADLHFQNEGIELNGL